MKIKLTQNKFAILSKEDANLAEYKWCTAKSGKTFYAVRNSSTINGKQHTIYMHRVIAERIGIKNPDHINRNGLDNRRSNLREANRNQQQSNQNKQKNNTSGCIGVCWDKSKWRAQIMVNRKQIYLGLFGNIKDAAKAYNKAALKYFGEFAVLNKV